MGFSEIVEAGTHVKTRLKVDAIEFQINGGQPQTRFFIGKNIASKLKWDGTTKVRVHHGDGEDYGWVKLVPSDEGLRVGRYGKNAFSVQLGKKKYFDISDPTIKIRETCTFKANKDGSLNVALPTEVMAGMGASLKERLTKEEAEGAVEGADE